MVWRTQSWWGGLFAPSPLPPPAGHRCAAEEQVERRGRRGRSSWALATVPQKRLFQDLNPGTHFRELGPRPLARDSLPLLPVACKGKSKPSTVSGPLPRITATQLHLPTAAPHPPLGSLHANTPRASGRPLLFYTEQRLISVSLRLRRLSSLCLVSPLLAHLRYDLPTAASLPATYTVKDASPLRTGTLLDPP